MNCAGKTEECPLPFCLALRKSTDGVDAVLLTTIPFFSAFNASKKVHKTKKV